MKFYSMEGDINIYQTMDLNPIQSTPCVGFTQPKGQAKHPFTRLLPSRYKGVCFLGFASSTC